MNEFELQKFVVQQQSLNQIVIYVENIFTTIVRDASNVE